MKIPLRVDAIQNDHARGHRCLSAAAKMAGVGMGYESLVMCVLLPMNLDVLSCRWFLLVIRFHPVADGELRGGVVIADSATIVKRREAFTGAFALSTYMF